MFGTHSFKFVGAVLFKTDLLGISPKIRVDFQNYLLHLYFDLKYIFDGNLFKIGSVVWKTLELGYGRKGIF